MTSITLQILKPHDISSDVRINHLVIHDARKRDPPHGFVVIGNLSSVAIILGHFDGMYMFIAVPNLLQSG
jgi:hypothetical protein